MTTKILTASALALLVSTAAVFAKGHDQGVADGTQPVPPGAAAGAVDDGQSKGQRGMAASDPETGRSGNAIDPVVGNGANAE